MDGAVPREVAVDVHAGSWVAKSVRTTGTARQEPTQRPRTSEDQQHPDDAGKFAGAVRSTLPLMKARFTAAREFLNRQAMVDPERNAAIGYCFGGGVVLERALVAISLGSVFMGAMSYIGNGPNFMVKSIAEQAGVRMPSFFGYMLYSVAILVPLFVGVTLIFL